MRGHMRPYDLQHAHNSKSTHSILNFVNSWRTHHIKNFEKKRVLMSFFYWSPLSVAIIFRYCIAWRAASTWLSWVVAPCPWTTDAGKVFKRSKHWNRPHVERSTISRNSVVNPCLMEYSCNCMIGSAESQSFPRTILSPFAFRSISSGTNPREPLEPGNVVSKSSLSTTWSLESEGISRRRVNIALAAFRLATFFGWAASIFFEFLNGAANDELFFVRGTCLWRKRIIR